jgi:hypothetical protein
MIGKRVLSAVAALLLAVVAGAGVVPQCTVTPTPTKPPRTATPTPTWTAPPTATPTITPTPWPSSTPTVTPTPHYIYTPPTPYPTATPTPTQPPGECGTACIPSFVKLGSYFLIPELSPPPAGTNTWLVVAVLPSGWIQFKEQAEPWRDIWINLDKVKVLIPVMVAGAQ